MERRIAQVDGRGIGRINRVVKITPQVLVAYRGERCESMSDEICIDTPISASIRIGHGASGNVAPDTPVVQLVLPSAQANFNIAQALAIG